MESEKETDKYWKPYFRLNQERSSDIFQLKTLLPRNIEESPLEEVISFAAGEAREWLRTRSGNKNEHYKEYDLGDIKHRIRIRIY